MKRHSSKKTSFPVSTKCVLKNILFLAIALFVVEYMFSKHPGYRWVYKDMLKGNMKIIREHPKLSFEQKMQMKLGASYEYLLFIKKSTPEDAVILYPSKRAFTKENSPFVQEIYNKTYATRFLHPRKLVLEEELNQNKYADKITHVAIVNKEGADKLPYPVDPEIQHTVLPVVAPKK